MEVEAQSSSDASDKTTPHSMEATQENRLPNIVSDTPRVGLYMWVLLVALLLPALAVALVGSNYVNIPHKTLWVLLLASPVLFVIVSLPKSYTISNDELRIQGWYYRFRIHRSTIVSCEPMKPVKAILHPGSIFCSDPSTALKISRKKGYSPVISPRNPELFMRILRQDPEDEKE